MTHYLLSIIQPDGPVPPREVLDGIMRNVNELRREMKATGALIYSGGLCPPATATVLRCKGSDNLMTDGPFIESKEHIGGLSIIQAADLDSALEWGRKLARATTLPVEVRPFYDNHGE